MNKKEKRTKYILDSVENCILDYKYLQSLSKQIGTTVPCVIETLLKNNYVLFKNS